jgi:hypothetical protein
MLRAIKPATVAARLNLLPDKGVLVTLRGKTRWREVEVACGSSDATCPVVALRTWLKFVRIANGPLFRRVPCSARSLWRGPGRPNAGSIL